jgi:hypothetical protein
MHAVFLFSTLFLINTLLRFLTFYVFFLNVNDDEIAIIEFHLC